MHDAEVVHGDLTTSNIMISQTNESDSASPEMSQIVFIDFGLGNMKPIVEDNAPGFRVPGKTCNRLYTIRLSHILLSYHKHRM